MAGRDLSRYRIMASYVLRMDGSMDGSMDGCLCVCVLRGVFSCSLVLFKKLHIK